MNRGIILGMLAVGMVLAVVLTDLGRDDAMGSRPADRSAESPGDSADVDGSGTTSDVAQPLRGDVPSARPPTRKIPSLSAGSRACSFVFAKFVIEMVALETGLPSSVTRPTMDPWNCVKSTVVTSPDRRVAVR